MTNWTLTSQVSAAAIQLRLLCCCPAVRESWFQIISSYSAGSICHFWLCESSDSPVYHHPTCTPLVWILSHRWVFQGFLGRRGIQRTTTGHRVSSGISSSPYTLHQWDPLYKHMGSPTKFYHWWHTALSFISTRQSNSSCMDLRLPGKHLGMDEGTSHAAQPGKDWASRFPCLSDSTAWFHHPARFIKNYSLVTIWPSRTIL